MYNLNIIFVNSLIFISFFCFVYAALIVYKNHRLLSKQEEEIDDSYNSVKVFFLTLETLLKFSIRKITRIWKLYFHYVILFILKTIDFINYYMSKFYSRLRNYFIAKSTENKSFVVHFWGDLKHYKREKDKEDKEEKEQ